MKKPELLSRDAASERGAALLVGLMFLLVLTVLGLTSSNVSLMQERMASNVAESNVAFQRAEGALRLHESFVRGTDWTALGAATSWQVVMQTLGAPINDCTLEATLGSVNFDDTTPWGGWLGNAGVPSARTANFEMTEYVLVSDPDLPFGNPCVPLDSATRPDGTPLPSEYYLFIAEGLGPGDDSDQGSAARRARSVVQAIYYRSQD
ncbi:MAG: hypothetical protein JJU31_08390 [Wenzhouxiangella sp.]|nr:hypothetical protein [Wenzhouxiangella sp.]